MQRMSAFKRVAIAMVVLSFVITGGVGAMGTVAADDEGCDISGPESLNADEDGNHDCENPSLNPFEGVLNNIFDFAQVTLQYAGFVAVFAGVTLWFATGANSDRAQVGVWLTMGGLAMIAFFFGYSTLISLLQWIAS